MCSSCPSNAPVQIGMQHWSQVSWTPAHASCGCFHEGGCLAISAPQPRLCQRLPNSESPSASVDPLSSPLLRTRLQGKSRGGGGETEDSRFMQRLGGGRWLRAGGLCPPAPAGEPLPCRAHARAPPPPNPSPPRIFGGGGITKQQTLPWPSLGAAGRAGGQLGPPGSKGGCDWRRRAEGGGGGGRQTPSTGKQSAAEAAQQRANPAQRSE